MCKSFAQLVDERETREQQCSQIDCRFPLSFFFPLAKQNSCIAVSITSIKTSRKLGFDRIACYNESNDAHLRHRRLHTCDFEAIQTLGISGLLKRSSPTRRMERIAIRPDSMPCMCYRTLHIAQKINLFEEKKSRVYISITRSRIKKRMDSKPRLPCISISRPTQCLRLSPLASAAP